ncbi:MAG: hypothetical protein RL088_4073 [Verrucomicrobiota bacterium]|jgi:hypothetical protein
MSLLLDHSKLGIQTTLRIDEPDLEELAMALHSSARKSVSRCEPDMPADLVWQRSPDGQWQIGMRGAAWNGESMTADALYLQTDSLLDDLVREQVQQWPLLHAGAISDHRRNALVFAGRSGSGKTSLVTAGVLSGFSWLSDELLCFRQADARVIEGFRRNFNLKERGFTAYPETARLQGKWEFVVNDERRRIRFFDPDSLNGGQFTSQAQLSAIVVPRFDPFEVFPVVEPLVGLELVRELSGELRSAGAASFAWLAETVRRVPGYRLRYKNPRAAVEAAVKLFPSG